MFEIVVSSSNNSDNRVIDEHHDNTSDSGSSSNSGSRSGDSSSSGGNNMDGQYTSGVPGVPLEVLQEELRMKAASGSHAGTSISASSSTTPDEVEIVYSCAVGVLFKTDEKRLTSFRSWYQIPEDRKSVV